VINDMGKGKARPSLFFVIFFLPKYVFSYPIVTSTAFPH